MISYIGANQDAKEMASNISIDNAMNFDTTSVGTHSMFANENRSRMNWFTRISEKSDNMSDNFFDENDAR